MVKEKTSTIRFKFSIGAKVEAKQGEITKSGIVQTLARDSLGNKYWIDNPVTGEGNWIIEEYLTYQKVKG